jgi:hypothetical protein
MRDDVVKMLVTVGDAIRPFRKPIAIAALSGAAWALPTTTLQAACDCQWANACYSEGGHVCYQGTDYKCVGGQWLDGSACS